MNGWRACGVIAGLMPHFTESGGHSTELLPADDA
jgi:hypothetical protein